METYAGNSFYFFVQLDPTGLLRRYHFCNPSSVAENTLQSALQNFEAAHGEALQKIWRYHDKVTVYVEDPVGQLHWCELQVKPEWVVLGEPSDG